MIWLSPYHIPYMINPRVDTGCNTERAISYSLYIVTFKHQLPLKKMFFFKLLSFLIISTQHYKATIKEPHTDILNRLSNRFKTNVLRAIQFAKSLVFFLKQNKTSKGLSNNSQINYMRVSIYIIYHSYGLRNNLYSIHVINTE